MIEPSITSTNSNYSIEIELVTSHSEGDLAGQSTYRVYVTTPNSSDIVTAVTGNDNFPLSLATTTLSIKTYSDPMCRLRLVLQ